MAAPKRKRAATAAKLVETFQTARAIAASAQNQEIDLSNLAIIPKGQIAPPPLQVEETIPELADLIPDAKAKLSVLRYIQEDIAWQAQESAAKKARKPLKTQIKDVLGKYKIGLALCFGYKVSYVPSESVSIPREKLLLVLIRHKVDPTVASEIADQATETTPKYTLSIRRVGSKEDGDE